jgi:hypothetical protein
MSCPRIIPFSWPPVAPEVSQGTAANEEKSVPEGLWVRKAARALPELPVKTEAEGSLVLPVRWGLPVRMA